MRFFGRPTSSQDRETDALLDALGSAERAAPDPRPGRFDAVRARLTPSGELAVRWKPMFAIGGGAALLAATIGVGVLVQDRQSTPETVTAQAVAVPATAVPAQTAVPVNQQPLSREQRLGDLTATADLALMPGTDRLTAVLGNRDYGTVPFVIKIKNNGAPFTGTVEVVSGMDTMDERRVYRYPIEIAGGGATTRKIVYAALASQWPRINFEVNLYGRGRTLSLLSGNVGAANGRNGTALGIIDQRVGGLQPRRDAERPELRGYNPYYIKPQNAPDRAAGYDALGMLVLGPDARALNPAQWNAIREWVKDGGQLILLGGGEAAEMLKNPVAVELAPMSRWHIEPPRADMSAISLLANQSMQRSQYVRTTVKVPLTDGRTVVDSLKPGVESLPLFAAGLNRGSATSPVTLLRRRFGAGSVLQMDINPTTPEFRNAHDVITMLWNEVARYEPASLQASMRNLSNESPWIDAAPATGGIGLRNNNPFLMTLPPLRTVLYVFLGYFVLVVPVSFVVLKQTRRMQYAWFTGPIAAVTFAGGLALFTTNLYTAPLSRRTAGIVAMEAGEGRARFHGFTELYIPRGGRYTLDLPGTERTIDGHSSYGYVSVSSNTIGAVTSTDDGAGEKPVTLDIPNLSFRRVFHDQTVSLGQGVTADLRIDAKGDLVGSVQNQTGLPLHQVVVMLREPRARHIRIRGGAGTGERVDERLIFPVRTYNLGVLMPGTRTIQARPNISPDDDGRRQRGGGGGGRAVQEPVSPLLARAEIWEMNGVRSLESDTLSPDTPLLVGQTSGESFGPRSLGRSIGGDGSVGVLVRLPAVKRLRPQVAPRSITIDTGEERTSAPAATITEGGVTR